MRKIYSRTTHSAALEPAEVNACWDCGEWLDDDGECACGIGCEACNGMATDFVSSGDEMLWLCDDCQESDK